MKSTNINPFKLADVLNGKLPINTVVGHAKDAHGTFYVAFVNTDETTKAPTWTPDGQRCKLNWRVSKDRPQS
jgi:hypothetical protein